MKDMFLSLNRRHLIERVPGKLGNKAAWRKRTGADDVAEPQESDPQLRLLL